MDTNTTPASPGDGINWDQTEEEQQAALDAAAAALKPKYVVVEKSLAVKYPSGEVIKISLDIKWAVIEDIMKSDMDPTEQLYAIFNATDQEELRDLLRRQGSIAVMDTAETYFAKYEQIIGGTPGEGSGSKSSE